MPVIAGPNLRSLNKEKTHFDTARRIANEIEEKNPILLAENVRQKIIEWFKENQDEDIETTAVKLSLIDPNSKTRIRKPVRSENCEHFQCFDLLTFLAACLSKERGNKAQEEKRWLCPVGECNAEAKQEQLRIDGYFMEILNNVGPEPLEVKLLTDGSWRAVEQEDFKVVPVGENDEIAQIVPRKRARVENTTGNASHSGTNPTAIDSSKDDDFAHISWANLGELLGVKKGDCPLEAIRSMKQHLEMSENEQVKLLQHISRLEAEIGKDKSTLSLQLTQPINNGAKKKVIFPSVINDRVEVVETIEGRVFRQLSVMDRLRCERVSPRWNVVVRKFGWTDQMVINDEAVFEDVTFIQRFNFTHLVSLLQKCGPWLRELDLTSFEREQIEWFYPQIFDSLKILETLDIRGLHLPIKRFVDHLPPTLREIKLDILETVSVETLQALSNRCPNLEKVPFKNIDNIENIKTKALVKLIGMFSRQKKLNLYHEEVTLRSKKVGALAPIGQLKELVELNLSYCISLDGVSLEAIVCGCQHLRSFSFNTYHLTEGELFQLTKLPNLTELEICDQSGAMSPFAKDNVPWTFSDAVLKAIARRGQLEKLRVIGSKSENASLTDASILYLVDSCKSLVSLALYWCPKISDRSLDSVVAEVRRRRHGTAPGTLPIDDDDPEIFYFYCNGTGIDEDRARQLIAGNPWMRFDNDDYDEDDDF